MAPICRQPTLKSAAFLCLYWRNTGPSTLACDAAAAALPSGFCTTVSVGVAGFELAANDFAPMLQAGDVLMYKIRQDGKRGACARRPAGNAATGTSLGKPRPFTLREIRMQLAIIAAILTAIVGVAFSMQNDVPVTVNFLLWRFDSSLAMVLLLALAAGATAVALLITPSALRGQWRLARQKRRITELEQTCEVQRSRIAELESHTPAADVAAAVVPPTCVGLRQLIAERADDVAAKPAQR